MPKFKKSRKPKKQHGYDRIAKIEDSLRELSNLVELRENATIELRPRFVHEEEDVFNSDRFSLDNDVMESIDNILTELESGENTEDKSYTKAVSEINTRIEEGILEAIANFKSLVATLLKDVRTYDELGKPLPFDEEDDEDYVDEEEDY